LTLWFDEENILTGFSIIYSLRFVDNLVAYQIYGSGSLFVSPCILSRCWHWQP